MMARVAALLVIVSQLLLIWVALEPTGRSAIVFTFVGHPILIVGFVLAFVALTRRLRREAAERAASSGSGEKAA
jgi:hypothetical protein